MKKNISILIALLVMGTASFAQKAKAPQIESLRDNTTVRAEELTSPDAISWTPVQPSKGNVTYKLTVVEILPGQEPGQAYRTNKPILEKDYKRSKSASISDPSILKPGKSYAFCVQALDDQDRPLGENEGRSGFITIHIPPAPGGNTKK